MIIDKALRTQANTSKFLMKFETENDKCTTYEETGKMKKDKDAQNRKANTRNTYMEIN